MSKHIKMQPSKFSEVGTAAVPTAFENVTLRCLEKERGDRYESMGALIADLEAAHHGGGTAARGSQSPSSAQSTSGPKRSVGRPAIISGAIIALLIVVCALSWQLYSTNAKTASAPAPTTSPSR